MTLLPAATEHGELLIYDRACRLIAEAKSTDEVKNIADRAVAMQAYARQVQNKDLETNAAEIRMRAERRLGEMIIAQKEEFGLHPGGRPSKTGQEEIQVSPPRLIDIGVDRMLSSRCQKMAALPTAEFEDRIETWRERIIKERARVTTNILRAGSKAQSRAEKEAALAGRIRSLPDAQFGVIVADPPWRFAVRSELGLDRSADNHYPTQTTDDICLLDVPSIAADDCVLYLWATVPMLRDALRVMEFWGFEYKSHCIWAKDRVGTGYWFRNQHELLLVGTKGRIPAPEPGTQWSSLIDAPVGIHSAKPEIFLEMIEGLYPNVPKLEMNRRGKARDGWSAWGLEVETDGPLPA